MRLDPKLFDAPYFYGRACLAQGKFAEAVRLFDRASVLRPDDFQAPSFLKRNKDSAGQPIPRQANHGAAYWEQRIELNPDDARAYNLAAATWLRTVTKIAPRGGNRS